MKRLPLLTAVACLLVIAGVANAGAPTPVTCGDTITAPGQYLLAGDCTGSGISINASDVHLKLGGHTMTSSTPMSGNGIEPFNVSGVYIEGPGEITNYSSGIFFYSVTNSYIVLVTSSGNAEGVELYGASSGNQITNNVTDGNSSNGIVLSPTTSGNHVDGNEANANQTGITAGPGSIDNQFHGNTALGNSTDLEDDNSSCDSNNWNGNHFVNANPSSCIH